MIQTITAIADGYCGNDKSASFTFDVPDHEFDLIGAIQKASAEYLMTIEGLETWYDKCELFNLEDFYEYVPNDICAKYGFQKVLPKDTIEVDFDEQMIDDAVFPFGRTEPGAVTSYLNHLLHGAADEELAEFFDVADARLQVNTEEAIKEAYEMMDEDNLLELAENWLNRK